MCCTSKTCMIQEEARGYGHGHRDMGMTMNMFASDIERCAVLDLVLRGRWLDKLFQELLMDNFVVFGVVDLEDYSGLARSLVLA